MENLNLLIHLTANFLDELGVEEIFLFYNSDGEIVNESRD